MPAAQADDQQKYWLGSLSAPYFDALNFVRRPADCKTREFSFVGIFDSRVIAHGASHLAQIFSNLTDRNDA
jgi:hypothetical protein